MIGSSMTARVLRSIVAAVAVLVAVGCSGNTDETADPSASQQAGQAAMPRLTYESEELAFGIQEHLHDARQRNGPAFLAGIAVEVRRDADQQTAAVITGQVLNRSDLACIAAIAIHEAEQGGKLAWDLQYPAGRIQGPNNPAAIYAYVKNPWSQETPTGWQ